MAASTVKRVVVMVQENHTTDHYFAGLAGYGANVARGWPPYGNPPPSPPYSGYYPPHHRRAYFDWLTAGKADHTQVDTGKDLPFYLYLAVTGAFLENHCSGFGTNSTPNHLLLIGGQSPTLNNPPRRSQPLWDMPSLPGLAQEKRVSWRAYTDGGYPVRFYTQLQGSRKVINSSQFVTDAAAGKLPRLVYLWHASGVDEHPPASVTDGMNAIWQAVDAVVQGGGWEETVFMLTWDDWGGFDDHVKPPVTEYTPDNVQLALGPRVPLLMFGGHVKPGIDSRWCSHASIPKTALQLLALPKLGVPRVDNDPGLADLVDPAMAPNAPPPGYKKAIKLPKPPSPTPAPNPLPPPPGGAPKPIERIRLRHNKTIAAPNDAPLPQQPHPPHN
jgi:hypothetical protein